MKRTKAEVPAPAWPVIERLRKGQPWLINNYDRWWDGSMPDAQWWDAFNLWDGLDNTLRFVSKFDGCPIEGGCSNRSPMVCRGCSGNADFQPKLTTF